ncbi:MAG: hypothetical protein PWR08_1491 [Thermoanaerobacterium sp.]|jgi:DNA-binding LacI/PurR family transcriptional regulator|nr:transcriptional regulator, LacI family [Fusobacteriales bacterium]MDN5317366.1 hypothetical protein [Thermoanaerobacterium sp.]
MSKKINIKELAKIAGVAQSTISRALNDKDGISIETKERIRKLAQEYGYKPNITAKRLVTKKSNTIGVFILAREKIDLEESTAFKYVEIILNEIKKKDYDLVLFSVDEDKPGVSYLRMCEERAVDGAIFIGFGEVDEHLEEIKNFEIPVVFIERNIKSKLSSIITTDNRKAMKIGIEYLIRIGHKEIGFLKGTKNSEVAKLRELYFKEIMKEKELLKEEYIFDSDFSIESGYNVAAKLLELDKMPTAIFTSSDLSAIGLIRGLKDCQIDVPNDISILGFDGFKISNFTIPRLTTIEQDFYSLGINAINILFDMIENKIVSKEIIKIPPKLIIRESTKPLLTD